MPGSEHLQPQGPERAFSRQEKHTPSGEVLRHTQESSVEFSPDRQQEQIEKARSEATREALMSKEAPSEQKQATEGSAPAIRRVTKQEKDGEYSQTLKRIQSHLSPSNKVLSRIIHAPGIERVSEIGASTVARPNAILIGGIVALIASSLTYFLARTLGYTLSGFETIGAFILGFLIGILYDFFKTMITGRNS